MGTCTKGGEPQRARPPDLCKPVEYYPQHLAVHSQWYLDFHHRTHYRNYYLYYVLAPKSIDWIAQWLVRLGLNQFKCCYLCFVSVNCLCEHARARAHAHDRA